MPGMIRMGRLKEFNAKRRTVTVHLTEETCCRLTEYAAEHNTTLTLDVVSRSIVQ